jgi:hypothetical protein
MTLFTLKSEPETYNIVSGNKPATIKVLAIQPFAITKDAQGLGPWASAEVASFFICDVGGELMRIASDDIWQEVDQGHLVYEPESTSALVRFRR